MFVESDVAARLDVAAVDVEHGVRGAVERAGAPEPAIGVAELACVLALELGRDPAVEDHRLARAQELVDPRVRRARGCRGDRHVEIMQLELLGTQQGRSALRRRSPMTEVSTRKAGLLERLETGPVICAEGYLFELERRGYLQAGAFVPEVVLEHPELVARAPSRVRARRLRRRRGVHLLRPPREAADDRQGGRSRADQPRRPRDREGGRRRDRRALRRRHLQHERLRARRRRVARGGARHVRGAGRLGRRRRRRLHHRRDLRLGRGGADRARGRSRRPACPR